MLHAMRKVTTAFLGRRPKPHAFLKRPPPPSLSFNVTLASSPDAPEVGACDLQALPHISMGGALETGKANGRKARGLKADKIDRGSLHAEICTAIAEETRQGRPSAKAKRKAKANVAQNAVLEEAQNAAPGRTEQAASFVFEEEKALQNAAIEISEEVANESIINAKKELSELSAKLELNTFKRGLQWEQTAYKLLDCGIPFAHIKKMLPKCRTLPCRTMSLDSTLKHFAMLGMSLEEMGRVISRSPRILYISNTVFQSQVEFFESVGIGRSSLGKIMHAALQAIGSSPNTLRERCDFWKDYFQDVREDALLTLILRNPRVLAWNLQTVKPKIAYFEELGFSKKMLLRCSSLLAYTPKAIAMKLKLFEKFGIWNTRSHVKAFVVLHGITPLKLHARLHNLLALGFSFDQVQKMTMNYPSLLSFSEDHINFRLSYAVNVMNLSFDALVAFPAFWGYNYEKRIKYRYEVLQELKTLGAYEKNMSLSYMLGMTDLDFSRRFVKRLSITSI